MTAPPASPLATRRGRLLLLLCAAVIALRATNSRGEPAQPSGIPAARDQVPAPELAD